GALGGGGRRWGTCSGALRLAGAARGGVPRPRRSGGAVLGNARLRLAVTGEAERRARRPRSEAPEPHRGAHPSDRSAKSRNGASVVCGTLRARVVDGAARRPPRSDALLPGHPLARLVESPRRKIRRHARARLRVRGGASPAHRNRTGTDDLRRGPAAYIDLSLGPSRARNHTAPETRLTSRLPRGRK